MCQNTLDILCIACYSPSVTGSLSPSLSLFLSLSGHRCVPLSQSIINDTVPEALEDPPVTSWMYVRVNTRRGLSVCWRVHLRRRSIGQRLLEQDLFVFPFSYDFFFFFLLLSREEGTECLSHWLAWKLGHSWLALPFCFWCLSVCWKVSASTGRRRVVLEWLIEFFRPRLWLLPFVSLSLSLFYIYEPLRTDRWSVLFFCFISISRFRCANAQTINVSFSERNNSACVSSFIAGTWRK